MVTVLSRFQSPKVRLVTSCGCLNLEIHCNIAEGLRWREGRGKETERNWVLKTPFFSVEWYSIWTSTITTERTPWKYESALLVVVGWMIRGDTAGDTTPKVATVPFQSDIKYQKHLFQAHFLDPPSQMIWTRSLPIMERKKHWTGSSQ